MGCVGWNAMGEIAGYAGDAVGEMADYAGDAASEVADATLHSGVRGGVAATNEGSHFEIDASEVNAIDLNWLAGSGSVRVVPDSETGGAIVVNETMHGGPQPVMACSTNDGVLSIDYMEGSGGLSGCSLGTWGSKDVELLIPESAASLERFVLEAASGEYGIDGADAVLCGKMELDVASGSVSVSRRQDAAHRSGVRRVSPWAVLACSRNHCGLPRFGSYHPGASRRHGTEGQHQQDLGQLHERLCRVCGRLLPTLRPFLRHYKRQLGGARRRVNGVQPHSLQQKRGDLMVAPAARKYLMGYCICAMRL